MFWLKKWVSDSHYSSCISLKSRSKYHFCNLQGGPVLIPGFCLPKALQPLLPIFLQVFQLFFFCYILYAIRTYVLFVSSVFFASLSQFWCVMFVNTVFFTFFVSVLISGLYVCFCSTYVPSLCAFGWEKL